MKVFELAKELKVKSKKIVALLEENGVTDITHMTVLSDDQIEFIRSEMSTVTEIEEEKKVVVEEIKKKTDSDYRPDEMISCRSIFSGVLLFHGDHSGMTYTFNGIGDRRNIEYQDLKAAMLQQKSSMFNPDFVIEDANLLEDERWAELRRVYDSMYDEQDIKRVFALPTRDFEEEFTKLPITAKQTIITMIATQIENGTFEQYNKAKIVDKVCGTRFDLKM